jgi:hypothetical protein
VVGLALPHSIFEVIIGKPADCDAAHCGLLRDFDGDSQAARRLFQIDYYVQMYQDDKESKWGAWFASKLEALRLKKLEAETEIREAGITPDVVRDSWREQVAYHTMREEQHLDLPSLTLCSWQQMEGERPVRSSQGSFPSASTSVKAKSNWQTSYRS